MLDQPIPNPIAENPTTPQTSKVSSQDPITDASKKPMPLFLKTMIGCGGLLVLAILLPILIHLENNYFQLNPERNKVQINEVAMVIKNCISGEKSKGADDREIYSNEKCANQDFLRENKYTDKNLNRVIHISYGSGKICLVNYYQHMFGYTGFKKYITSWDSQTDVITEVGQGKESCN